MNEVSIIINGVRYDAVEKPKEGYVCNGCDICDLYDVEDIIFPCSEIIGSNRVFKKSDKKFEE